eukprot:TRINITY_DN4708_c0_g1_i1.p1 TRINITY_DN4708_c0_g1~~TRINITY_DN4708_c0_g1_i1.p1  ORF type:complete len:221 (-),score=75.32 TRINITY_DN4708_c0_g1_i1:120-782(-)
METQLIHIFVKIMNGKEVELDVNPENSIEEIKNKLKEKGETDVENISIKFKGKELKEDETKISEYNIVNKSRLMVFLKKNAPNPKVQAVQKKVEVPAERVKCAGNCGFWGDPLNDNLCSQCAKNKKENKIKEEEQKKKQLEEEKKKKEEKENEIIVEQTDFSKCWTCKRKIGSVEFKCDCGYIFCGKHRYPGEHSCPVDYRRKERQTLDKQIGYENSKFR